MAHNNLGLTYRKQGRLEEAMAELKQAVATDPTLAIAYNNLGTVYEEKGMLDEAISEYKKALSINPEYSKAAANLSDAYSKKGSLDDPLSQYQKVLAANPDNAEAHYKLGMMYSTKGRLEEAIFHFRQAITLNPKYVNAYNNLAWIYATSPHGGFRNAEQAISLATKACELTNYQNANLLDTLAAAYAAAGNFKKAMEYQSSAIDVSKEEEKPALLKCLEGYKMGQASRSQ
jgi:tetratricopeptide (TPR) repeat protein